METAKEWKEKGDGFRKMNNKAGYELAIGNYSKAITIDMTVMLTITEEVLIII